MLGVVISVAIRAIFTFFVGVRLKTIITHTQGGFISSIDYAAVPEEFSGASASCATDGSGNFSCVLEFNPQFTVAGKTFARFRLTSDPAFFSNASPSPTGSASNGEVEDYDLDFDPTAVTIGDVELGSVPVPDFLGQIGVEQMDVTALYALLTKWAPDLAASVDANDREAILRHSFSSSTRTEMARSPLLHGRHWRNEGPLVFTLNVRVTVEPGLL